MRDRSNKVGQIADIGDGLYKVHVSDADGTDSVLAIGRNGKGFRFATGLRHAVTRWRP